MRLRPFSVISAVSLVALPVLLLLLEARPDGTGNLRWEYASRRLGIWSTSLRLDDREVSFSPVVRMADEVQDDWTFYFLPREFD